MSRIEYLKKKDDVCGLDKAERRELIHLMINLNQGRVNAKQIRKQLGDEEE